MTVTFLFYGAMYKCACILTAPQIACGGSINYFLVPFPLHLDVGIPRLLQRMGARANPEIFKRGLSPEVVGAEVPQWSPETNPQ